MSQILPIAGWVIWALGAVVGVASRISTSADPSARDMQRTWGFLLVCACALFLFIPYSKLWLLLVAPATFLVPMVLMQRRGAAIVSSIERLKAESERTGRPLTDLLNEETERMKSGR